MTLKKTIFAFCTGLVVVSTAAIPAMAQSDPEGAAPGPGQEARQKLFERIQQAKSQGIGIGGYLNAFRALEEQAKGGAAPESLNPRIDQIHKSINDQLDRAKILKTQRPLPPQGSQLRGSDPIGASGGGPAAGGGAGGPGGAGGMAEKIKARFGDKLDNLPEGLKERLSDPGTRQKLMEKFGERGGDVGGLGGLGGLGGGGGAPAGPGPGGAAPGAGGGGARGGGGGAGAGGGAGGGGGGGGANQGGD